MATLVVLFHFSLLMLYNVIQYTFHVILVKDGRFYCYSNILFSINLLNTCQCYIIEINDIIIINVVRCLHCVVVVHDDKYDRCVNMDDYIFHILRVFKSAWQCDFLWSWLHVNYLRGHFYKSSKSLGATLFSMKVKLFIAMLAFRENIERIGLYFAVLILIL